MGETGDALLARRPLPQRVVPELCQRSKMQCFCERKCRMEWQIGDQMSDPGETISPMIAKDVRFAVIC